MVPPPPCSCPKLAEPVAVGEGCEAGVGMGVGFTCWVVLEVSIAGKLVFLGIWPKPKIK